MVVVVCLFFCFILLISEHVVLLLSDLLSFLSISLFCFCYFCCLSRTLSFFLYLSSLRYLRIYRNQAEMSQTCRGTISLHSALIHTVDSCTFVITNGGTQTFHIKASNEVERQNWVTALELAKAKSM